jgi:hypothetical protein
MIIKSQALERAKTKMISACQNGNKKAWRKWGREVYRLQKELSMDIDPWMEKTFGRLE